MASVTFKRGTRAEIEATAKQDGQILMETDQNKKNKMYIDLPDGSRVLIGNSGEAIDTSYDNTTSGIDATNVQSAIDELDNTVDTLNSNLSLRPYMKTYYSSSKNQISITLTEKSRYGMLIFGGANGSSFFGAVDIESTGANMCHAFLGGQLKEIAVSNNDYVVTLDGLSKYGFYTVISPYKIL